MIGYYAGQSDEIARVFQRAVRELAGEHYTQTQIDAWAPEPLDYARWRWRCEWKRPFVYLVEGRVAGFLELDADGHIDCHYVHPDFARQGVGGRLLLHVLEVARQVRLERLYVEASHLARGLYAKHGFAVVRENRVARGGVELSNWIMERQV